MKSLLARAGSGGGGSKKDLKGEVENEAQAQANGGMIPDTSVVYKEEEAEAEKAVYAVTTRQEVPPRAVPSVRACVRVYTCMYMYVDMYR